MKIIVEGYDTERETWTVKSIGGDPYKPYSIPFLECINDKGEEAIFQVARDAESAWEAAKAYLRNMANNDVVARCPEEILADYDHWERAVYGADDELIEALGFTPTLAYRVE